MSRHDRYGERIDDEPLAPRRCLLCRGPLVVTNYHGICAECRLIVRNVLGVEIPERWKPAVGLDGVIVSDHGRVARVLAVDTAHRYPRISIGGEKRYLHHLVAEAWHGERPVGLLALHADDVPDHNDAANLSWGTAKQNAADARRNRKERA